MQALTSSKEDVKFEINIGKAQYFCSCNAIPMFKCANSTYKLHVPV